MVERGQGGHLVNIASAAAFAPTAMLPAYSATKAAVRMLSDCLRAELAPSGIGVSAICPGFTNTGIGQATHYAGTSGETEQRIRAGASRAFRMRGFPPEKVAVAVLRAVRDNRAVVPVNTEARVSYALSRIAPGTLRWLARPQRREVAPAAGTARQPPGRVRQVVSRGRAEPQRREPWIGHR